MLIITCKITPSGAKRGLKWHSHILVATAFVVSCRMLTHYLLATNTLKSFWVKFFCKTSGIKDSQKKPDP